MKELRVSYQQLEQTLRQILLNKGFEQERAQLCARLFARASLDGVASHGLNRFPQFLEMIAQGLVQVNARPALQYAFGPFERWDGQQGAGPLNAHHCMERAVSLAKGQGIGCVALSNTNHWMRAGNYGWQAVESGCLGICFTNTKPNMPAWGGSEPLLGNNPLVIAIPRKKGPLVLDMAMSQYAYGKMNSYLRRGEQLPYAGGFDENGELSRDPALILDKELALPIGLWKGAGLSLMLDVMAALLSEGKTTKEVGREGIESEVSQFFLVFDPERLGIKDYPEEKLDSLINQLKESATFGKNTPRYPGERTLATRQENLEKGIPVDAGIWEEVLTAYEQT